ncbi:hypothetical protein [Ferrimonas lipolytica]|uniref:Uncharacterized protein n=1 Tax=Ferrimonas lipolytica TaxID=2724191 RepID=A0A6H1UJR4_9GAMM|nr:hypothetical protein [Ferrimonas lipolytica]QIZ78042.1 hypothetical protein HER31_14740 [Ferrimonas lipolytica]
MTDKFHYRRAMSGKWQMAERAKAVELAIATEAEVHNYFRGATGIDQVANKITEMVLAQQPELLDNEQIDNGVLLQMLAVAAQATVLQALDQPQPSQISMLVLSVSKHFASKQYDPELSPELQQLQQQLLNLHQHWQKMLAQRRDSHRSMGR